VSCAPRITSQMSSLVEDTVAAAPAALARSSSADTHVLKQLGEGNEWYVGDQFAWASRPGIRRIYEGRERFLRECIARTQGRLGRDVRLLDAGCGDGYWLRRLGGIDGLELTGVDYNPVRVARARRAAPGARVEQTDLCNLGLCRSFDIVLLNQVVEHVADDVGLLRALRRVLNPGGALVLGTCNEGSPIQLRQVRRRGPEATDHVHFYTEREIRRKLRLAGYRVRGVMREVFYFFNDRLYYRLIRGRTGFGFLKVLTRLFPSGCSDYYFECAPTRSDARQ